MNKTPEPKSKIGECVYCGDSPTNHFFSYVENLALSIPQKHFNIALRYTSHFIVSSLDNARPIIFATLAFFGFAKFKDDIEGVKSFRSRVIWEEALRRGLHMEQVYIYSKPLETYRVSIGGQRQYFFSLPIPPKRLKTVEDWDDKCFLKQELLRHKIPVPKFVSLPFFNLDTKKYFNLFEKPIIVKPREGSRGRHTTTNIYTSAEFEKAIKIGGIISSNLIMEEHLEGDICRATVVDGKLAGFYRAGTPKITGDGKKTVRELIEEKNENRPERIGVVKVGREIEEFIARLGFTPQSVVPNGHSLSLTHRTGRLFGGMTKEMIDELHPSFISILENAAKVTSLPVAGFDCVIPDPTKEAGAQKWGIIECNTLPFIDLHYYALEGKPRNIAGMIWDLWE